MAIQTIPSGQRKEISRLGDTREKVITIRSGNEARLTNRPDTAADHGDQLLPGDRARLRPAEQARKFIEAVGDDLEIELLDQGEPDPDVEGAARDVDYAEVDSTESAVTAADPNETNFVEAVDGGTGVGNAAELEIGDNRDDVNILVDTSGAATLTVEVQDGDGNWIAYDSVDYSAATETYEGYSNVVSRHIRAYLDANRGAEGVHIQAKGAS